MMDDRVTEIWWKLHHGLRTFIAKRVADDAAIDDILQEVFLCMHRRIDGLRDPRRVVPWVYQITRNVIVDHYRSAVRREIPAGLSGDMDDRTSAGLPLRGESGPARSELAACLRPMLDRLGHEYREAMILVELEGLTQRTAAKRLGLSLSGMKSRVQRGRKQLKKMLDECCVIQLDRRRGVIDYEVRQAACNPCDGSSKPGPP